MTVFGAVMRRSIFLQLVGISVQAFDVARARGHLPLRGHKPKDGWHEFPYLDMGEFYRIPADNRNLNYAIYFSEGEKDLSKIEDYHSHNTEQLGVEGMKALLSKQPYVKREVFGDLDAVQYPG
ncbi:MAG: hypothetical protein EOP04_12420 [Proteobacteria bacterium]|nr:MAG: hypothetical protein EOP04_12420 [Pseudomonadota bacterium]